MFDKIYLVHHRTLGDVPQRNWIPTAARAPRDWQLGYAQQADSYLKRQLGNDPRLIYSTPEQLPANARWIYEVCRHYSMEPYSQADHPLLSEFFSVPRLVADLHSGLGYIFYNDTNEGDVLWHSQHMLALFTRHNIPLHRVIFASGASNVAQLITRFGGETQSLHVNTFEIGAQHTLRWDSPLGDHGPQEARSLLTVPQHKTLHKRFVCFNRVLRLHRIQLLAHMVNRGLLHDCFYSFSPVVQGTHMLHYCQHVREPQHWHTVDTMRRLEPQLPLILDRQDFDTNFATHHQTQDVQFYYDHSAISVVTETLFYDTAVFFSEKTFHPMRYGQPFVMVGAPGMLRQLRELGYRTWHNWFDESYDDISDHHQRLEAIVALLHDISQWPDHKLQQFLMESRDNCVHNQLWLFDAIDRQPCYFDQLCRLWPQ